MERARQTRSPLRFRALPRVLLIVPLLILHLPAAADYHNSWSDPWDPYWQQLDFMLDGLSALETGLNYLDPLVEDETFGLLKDIYDFTDALRKDIETHGNERFSPERSHTLEQSAKYLLGRMPELVEHLQKTEKISKAFRLPATFGAEDVMAGIGRHMGAGTADIETITYYLDGLNKACWGVLGYMVGGPEGARVYQSLGGTAAKLLRKATLPLFEKGVLKWRGQGKRLVSDWRTLQDKRLQIGLAAQRISDVYGHQLLRDNGLSDREIAEFDAEADAKNAGLSAMKRDLSAEKIEEFAASGELEVGGVSIDLQLIRIGEGGEELRKRTLDSRPSDDALSWPVELPDEEGQ